MRDDPCSDLRPRQNSNNRNTLPTGNLPTTAKTVKMYLYCFFTKTKLTRQRISNLPKNYYLATHEVSTVLFNLILEFVEIEWQFFESGLLEFLFDNGILLPIIKRQSYKNKFAIFAPDRDTELPLWNVVKRQRYSTRQSLRKYMACWLQITTLCRVHNILLDLHMSHILVDVEVS